MESPHQDLSNDVFEHRSILGNNQNMLYPPLSLKPKSGTKELPETGVLFLLCFSSIFQWLNEYPTSNSKRTDGTKPISTDFKALPYLMSFLRIIEHIDHASVSLEDTEYNTPEDIPHLCGRGWDTSILGNKVTKSTTVGRISFDVGNATMAIAIIH